MSKVNLNFQELYTDSVWYDKNFFDYPTKTYISLKDYKKFYKQNGICPFCKEEMPIVYDDYSSGLWLIIKGLSNLVVRECDCGFWELFLEYQFNYEDEQICENNNIEIEGGLFIFDPLEGFEKEAFIVKRKIFTAVKNVEDKKKEKAVKQLINEIQNNNKKIYSINPKELEIITQYVFSAYFDCEVEHIGKSHDGGIDLLIANSDKPILVQVKRRSKNDAIESVSTIRDFLGAMYIKNNFKGIVVSTAKRFSKKSKKDITSLLEENRLEYFELFDFNRFVSILDVVNDTNKKNWIKYVENLKK